MKIKIMCLLCLILLNLSACGLEGSSDKDKGVNVSAGSDQTVNESELVNLAGSAKGASEFTYAWTSTNSDITINHSDTNKGDASFVAPTVRTSPIFIQLTLTATSKDGVAVQDSLTVTVNPVNSLPKAVIEVTQDTRFANNTFPGDVALVMKGNQSTDDDPIDANAPISAYQWAQVSGTNITTGATLNAATVSLTTPILNAEETLTFSLTVTDSEGATHTETVDIKVMDVTKSPPKANAGKDLELTSGETVILTGSASSPSAAAQPGR